MSRTLKHQRLQPQISGELQLLDGLKYSQPVNHEICLRPSDGNAKKDIEILNFIALALSRNKHDMTGTAFDKRGSITLVVAKHGIPSQDDRQALDKLIKAVTDPDDANIFPTLLSHCYENMNHRVASLHLALKAIDINLLLDNYTPNSPIDQELPGNFKEENWTESTPFRAMVSGRYENLVSSSGLSVTVHPDDTTSRKRYEALARRAYVFQRSLVLQHYVSEPRYRPSVSRLLRRLRKVCEYLLGIRKLVSAVRRRFLDGIPYRWIECDHVATPVTCEDPCFIIQTASNLDPSAIPAKYPDLIRNWKSELMPRPHAELQIILALHPMKHIPGRLDLLVGVSKRSCLSCTDCISRYNDLYGTSCSTTRMSGKPDSSWATPDCEIVGSNRDILLTTVKNNIRERLRSALWEPSSDSDDVW